MNLPGPQETNLVRIVAALREIAEGATNALARADAELGPGTETRIDARLCVPGALVSWAELDPAAAAAQIWLKDTARGFFVLGHLSGPEGRRLRYEIRRF